MGLMIVAGLVIVGVGALLAFLASLRVGRGQFAGSGADIGRALVRALRVGTLLLVLYVVALWASGSLNGGIAVNHVFGRMYAERPVLPFEWGSPNVYARAGQKLVLSYDMTCNRGALELRLWRSKPLIGVLGPFGGDPIWSGSIEQTEVGKIEIPIDRDGYYLFSSFPWYHFAGRYWLRWHVE